MTRPPPLYGFVTPAKTIGRVKSFHGQFGMMVRAYTYMRMHGPEGLRAISEYAVLNANYLLSQLKRYLPPALRPGVHARVRAGRHVATMRRRSTPWISPSA